MARPLAITAYGALANLLAPVAQRRVAEKLARADLPAPRLKEPAGHATAPRPEGQLIWFHAASVGESLSVLPLIELLLARRPALSALVTTQTVSSAQLLAKRLPAGAVHQFAPVDGRRQVTRFLDHWRPDAAVFVESELWPQLIAHTAARGIPLALLNARLSERSARNWARLGGGAAWLLERFAHIHCQDNATVTRLARLGVRGAVKGTNLKSFAPAPPVTPGALAEAQGWLGGRPVWLASSTHPGEDALMIESHRALMTRHPEALLILVPRHPERGDAIAELVTGAGLCLARRSQGDRPGAQTQLYLADTLGELGLWYRLAPITCLCGSFTPVGGHNPYEPARAGSAILHGPLHANFPDTYAEFAAAGAAREVADAAALTAAVAELIADPEEAKRLSESARALLSRQEDALDAIGARLLSLLDREAGP